MTPSLNTNQRIRFHSWPGRTLEKRGEKEIKVRPEREAGAELIIETIV